MATIVTRAGKGSALTWTEGDANITNLNNELITKVSSISGTSGRVSVTGTTTPTIDLASGVVTAGTYTGKITVDTYGRVTAADNTLVGYGEGAIYSLGTTSGTITPNVTNGNVQTITLNGNLTFSAFTSPVAGQSLTLIIKQDSTGSRTLTSTMKFAGGSKTLSTAANSIDILSVYYDGTTYYASLAKGFV